MKGEPVNLTPLVEDYSKEFQVAAAAEIKVIPDPSPQLMSLCAAPKRPVIDHGDLRQRIRAAR